MHPFFRTFVSHRDLSIDNETRDRKLDREGHEHRRRIIDDHRSSESEAYI